MFRLLRIFLRPARKTAAPPPPEHDSFPEEGVEHPMLPEVVSIDRNDFAERTGYEIIHEEFFLEAFIHRSYLQLCPAKNLHSNERLEFLGDSILNFIVGEYLFSRFPEAEEGHLTKVRSRLVSGRALADCSRRLHLDDFIHMSPSAHQSVRNGSESILVDAFEAVVAAIYLDGGMNAARAFVVEHLLKNYSPALLVKDENYKSRLLELAQAQGRGVPRYMTVNEEGPDHSPVFTVEVQLYGRTLGMGIGRSKKSAEQMAASKALEFLLTHPDDIASMPGKPGRDAPRGI